VTPLPVPARALAIVAHPDDAEFQAGAALARWASGGCTVSVLVCTDGSKGSWDPGEDVAALIATREREQRAALAALGGTGECVFLGNVDGELAAGLHERGQVAAVIRRLRPEVVLGHDPWKRYRLHPDHRSAGFLAVDGVVAARDPHFFPEQGLAPWRPSSLLLFEPDEANHVEPVTGEALAAKVSALLAHRSQFRSTHGIDLPVDDSQRAAFAGRIAEACAGGEVFRRIDEL
jgi:LmbE family N-acetylglucosaminyl deacetylase